MTRAVSSIMVSHCLALLALLSCSASEMPTPSNGTDPSTGVGGSGSETAATNQASSTTGSTAKATESGSTEPETSGVESDTTGVDSATTGVDSATTGVESDTTGVESDTTGIESDTTGVESDTTGVESDTTGVESDSTGTGTGTGTTASDTMGPIGAMVCEDFVEVSLGCNVVGPGGVEYCEFQVQDHPAVADVAACEQAIYDRLTCYTDLDCDDLHECSLWGCTFEPDPCPAEAAMVAAACERTECERYFDQRNACGFENVSSTLPGYCEYVAALESLTAADPEACTNAFRARAGCYAQLECEELEQCWVLGCDAINPCPEEELAFEAACN